MKIRNATTLAVILALAVLAGVLVIPNLLPGHRKAPRFKPAKLPFMLRDVEVVRAASRQPFFVADVDGDGNDDILVDKTDRLIWYRLRDGEAVQARECVYERPGTTRMVTDADGDGRQEFFVSEETPKGSMLSCHDWFEPGGPEEAVYTVGPLFPPAEPGGRSPRKMKFFGGFAAEKGAHPTIFVGGNSVGGNDKFARYILAFDGVTGRTLWRFEFGPYSQELTCGTLDGGQAYVVLTTAAVANGLTYNGIPDSLSFVFCLNPSDGGIIWRKEIGGFNAWGCVTITDIVGDGRKEIVIGRHLRKGIDYRNEVPPWTVEALDERGSVSARVLLPSNAETVCPMTARDDSLPEIVVELENGGLAILEHGLKIKRTIDAPKGYKTPGTQLYGVWEVGSGGRPGIFHREDSLLVVHDLKGRMLAGRRFKIPFDARHARIEGKSYVVVGSPNAVQIMTLKRTPVLARLRSYSRDVIVMTSAALLLGVWGTFHTRRLMKRRRERGIDLSQEQIELLTAMVAYGHGGSSLKALDRVRFYLQNWERIRSEGAAGQERFARAYEAYRRQVMPELEQIVMLARRARVPEENWDMIASRARLADEHVGAILAAGPEEDAHRAQRVAKALEALKAVDELLAGIRRHLRSLFRTPVMEALESLIARFRDEYSERGISFALAPGPADDAVFVSPLVFDKVFEVILSNAARATEGKTAAEVAIAIQCEGTYCQIDVRDNGCGIARDDFERVFVRDYTTKPEGGGFGLYYAREQLAKFMGKIYVVDSVVGSGTTMRVVLRISEKAGTA